MPYVCMVSQPGSSKVPPPPPSPTPLFVCSRQPRLIARYVRINVYSLEGHFHGFFDITLVLGIRYVGPLGIICLLSTVELCPHYTHSSPVHISTRPLYLDCVFTLSVNTAVHACLLKITKYDSGMSFGKSLHNSLSG